MHRRCGGSARARPVRTHRRAALPPASVHHPPICPPPPHLSTPPSVHPPRTQLHEHFDGRSLGDSQGYASTATVEYAPNSATPDLAAPKDAPPASGTIEGDADYAAFVASLQTKGRGDAEPEQTFDEWGAARADAGRAVCAWQSAVGPALGFLRSVAERASCAASPSSSRRHGERPGSTGAAVGGGVSQPWRARAQSPASPHPFILSSSTEQRGGENERKTVT